MDKSKRGGVVGDLITGTGGLIVLTIVILVIVSTLLGANLLRGTATTTSASDTNIGINSTGHTLASFDVLNRGYTVTEVLNNTNSSQVVGLGNFTLNTATGLLTNATSINWISANVTYSYFTPTTYEDAADGMGANFTGGIDNVSTKIPTILLIGAVVLLFGVIVLLVRQSQAMGIGASSGSGSL